MTLFSIARNSAIGAMLFPSLFPFAAHAESIGTGSLVKSQTNTAVYYIAGGKRYAFPNERVFYSWYPNFSSVVSVTPESVANYPLVGNITFRPGTQLVKLTTDPKVYAVSRYGVLRWVMSESAAEQLYGVTWRALVEDLPDTFFSNYVVGSPIGAGQDFAVNDEQGVTAFIDNIRSPGFVAPQAPTTPVAPGVTPKVASIVVGVSASQATLNQMVLVFAQISNATNPISKINLFADGTTPIKTCFNSTTCSAMYTVVAAPLNIRFHAEAFDDHGQRITSTFEQDAPLTVAAVTSDIQLQASPQMITAGSRINFSSDAQTYAGITSHKIYLMIPGEPNAIVWKDCKTDNRCDGSSPLYRTSQFFSTVTVGGQTNVSASVTVAVSGGEPPKPVLSISSKPAPNQVVLHLQAPSGETIGWSSIVVGTSPDNEAIGLCEFSTCDLHVQFSTSQTYTAFTDVGGKLETSNSVTVSP